MFKLAPKTQLMGPWLVSALAIAFAASRMVQKLRRFDMTDRGGRKGAGSGGSLVEAQHPAESLDGGRVRRPVNSRREPGLALWLSAFYREENHACASRKLHLR